jgi:5-methylcytosine-specific restriction endonuclease McrA
LDQIFKTCTKCGKKLPATSEYFNSEKKSKDGLKYRCKDCYKEYRIANKERRNEQMEKWRRENKDHERKRAKEYYQEHKKHLIEYAKKYRQENSELAKKSFETWKQKNKEYFKNYRQINRERRRKQTNAWRQNNPEKTIIHKQNRRANERKVQANYTIEQLKSAREYFDNKCAYCGKEKKLEQDHFIPLSKGGEYTINNIVPTCRSCNSSKGTKDFFEWYKTHKYYSKKREDKILKYLNYYGKVQQLALTI